MLGAWPCPSGKGWVTVVPRGRVHQYTAASRRGERPHDPLQRALLASLCRTARAMGVSPRKLAPRVLVHVGTTEVLLDDSLRLADRAEVHVWNGMPHVFAGTLQPRAAHLALDHIAAFIRS